MRKSIGLAAVEHASFTEDYAQARHMIADAARRATGVALTAGWRVSTGNWDVGALLIKAKCLPAGSPRAEPRG